MHLHGARARSEINVTPLVDVVLVLLIIFMLVTPLLQARHDVALARRSASRAVPRAALPPLVVRAAADGRVHLDGEVVAVGSLAARVRERLRDEPRRGVVFAGDDALAYGAAIAVLDALRAGGAEPVAVAVDDPVPRG